MTFIEYVILRAEGFPETVYKICRTEKEVYIATAIVEWTANFHAPSAVIIKVASEWKCQWSSHTSIVPRDVINKLVQTVTRYHEITEERQKYQ